jgi:hypothetical protein
VSPAWERAIRGGDVETVRAMLANGADVDARDRHGQTALMIAAHHGHRDLVQTLVDAGAALNTTAKYHLTALMLAIIGGHALIARALIDAGADLDVRGSGAPGFAGKTAYDLAVHYQMTELYAALTRERS